MAGFLLSWVLRASCQVSQPSGSPRSTLWVLEADLQFRSYDAVKAKYYGIPTLVQRTALEVSLANFTVLRDANALSRPVAGGVVASGTLKNGRTVQTNITNNTLTGRYTVQSLATFGYNQTVDNEFLI